jgi:toxin YoeB
LRKISKLLQELEEHPETGTGKPEKMKYKKTEYWSRRIDKKHRMEYTIDNDIVNVLLISLWGHYGDKWQPFYNLNCRTHDRQFAFGTASEHASYPFSISMV